MRHRAIIAVLWVPVITFTLWTGVGVAACLCPCHADPQCDSLTNVFDVVQTVNVAFRWFPAVIDPGCPVARTDNDCSGHTDVLDVVAIVDVAFRNQDPATTLCDPCPPRIFALTNGFLIDGSGSEPVPDAVVVIRDDRIDQVGTAATIDTPDNAVIINLEGATILPGFFNTHVHNGYDQYNLRTWARGGVTTIRDLGANPKLPLYSMRDDLMTDSLCARLVCAGPMVTVPGGYPTVPWGSVSALPVTSVEDARTKMEYLLDAGADLIKIALERGDIFGQVIPVLSPDMATEIVAVAHERATVVSAHITASRDLELALAAGVDEIAHMAVTTLSDNLIDQLVATDTYWVPTLELWHGVGYGYPDIAEYNLGRFVLSGGQVALGTDYDGYSTPFELGMPISEIGWMHDAGMTPMQIIVAATKNAAHVCNLDNELGTIEPGKIADILIVNGNPLTDIETALTSVRMVIHNGAFIVDNGAR